MKKICIIGASGKLGRYMIGHALDRGYEVVGVCREKSVDKLDEFKDRMTIISGLSSKNVAGNREIIKKAVDKLSRGNRATVVMSCASGENE